jgi:hypothetical protein
MAQSLKTLRSADNLIGVTVRPITETESQDFAHLNSNESRIAFLRTWASAAIKHDAKNPSLYERIIEESSAADRAYFAA